MKHLIMGTAGHVDHGKTALVKALTGIECDTHKDEKKRGITINLGFAHAELPGGDTIGIVDVPGHKSFVHTMVGGASGIDFALLVVAADSGVMPQTKEHLQIMETLGVSAGLVAVTRIDLAEPDIADMAVEETRDMLGGTFLEGCPVVKVSSVTGEGIDDLRTAIQSVADAVVEPDNGEVFRMFIDRIFSVSGFGTVVTGSVMSGTLKTGATAYVLPGVEDELRVRRLERHGEEVEKVRRGDRASVNLVGLDRSDFERGMIVSDRLLRSTRMLDARLTLFSDGHDFKLWNQVLFHLGTFECTAKVHLMDTDRLPAGQTAITQIHLPVPCVIEHGDTFVLRSSSGDITLGGGEVIDAAPLHHRRRPDKLIEKLHRIADGELGELIVSEVQKRFGALSTAEIADSLNVPLDDVNAVVESGAASDLVSYGSGKDTFLLVDREDKRLREAVVKRITSFHRTHPLLDTGRTIEELSGSVGIDRNSPDAVMLRHLLNRMVSDGALKQVGRTWALATHEVEISADMAKRIEAIEGFLKNCGMQTPLMNDLKRTALRHDIDDKGLHELLRYLVSSGRACHVDGNYLHASIVDESRSRLLAALSSDEGGMSVSGFRDLVGGNRKICLLLLAIYDGEGTTRRQGDVRVITEEGRRRA